MSLKGTVIEELVKAKGGKLCDRCGCCEVLTERETCQRCHGEGFIDLSEDDPINFVEGEEFERCEDCKGEGGFVIEFCSCDDGGKHR